MILLPCEQPRVRQPEALPEIDWNNPITRGLAFAYHAPSASDAVRATRPVSSTSDGRNVGTAGIGGYFSVASNYEEFSSALTEITGPLTIIGVVRPDAGATQGRIVSKAALDGTNNPFRLSFEPTVNGLYFLRSGSSAFGAWRPNAVALSAGVESAFGVVSDGSLIDTVPAFYSGLSGVNLGATRPFGSGSEAITGTDAPLRVGQWDTASGGMSVFHLLIFARALSAAEYVEVASNPNVVFEPELIWVPVSAGGGNVYNEAITESLSSSDAIACAAAFARAASEAALATDSQSATGTLAAAASESASATDAPVSVLVASAAVSESGSAADAVSAGAASYDVTVTEAASAADAVSVIATRVAAVSEALSAADAYTVTATMGAAVSENGSAADAVNWGGASYSVDIAETGTLADAVSAALQALAAISEVAGATDTPVAIISAGAAVLESAAAADLLAAARQITALLSEPATATDAVTFDADNVINAGIEESANATDGYVAVLIDGFLVLTASPRRVLTAGASRPANLAGAMRPHNLPGRGR